MWNVRVDEGLKLRTEFEVDVFGSGGIHTNGWEVNFSPSGGGKLDLGLLSSLANCKQIGILMLQLPVMF